MEKSVTAVSSSDERDFNFLRELFIAVFTFLLSLSPLFEKLSPFSAALMATLSGADCIAAFFGSVTGYTAAGNFALAIPHITAMTVITAMRFIIGRKHSFATDLISAIMASVVIFIANFAAANSLSDIFTGFAFAVITFITVWAINAFLKAKDKPVTDENKLLLLSGGVIYTLLIAAFSGLTFELFNMGIFLSALSVIAAPYIRDRLSAPVGILSAVGVIIGEKGFSGIAVILALSALLSSLLSSYGRVTRACGLIFALGTGVIITGINEYSAVCMASAFFGAVTAVFIPEKFIPAFENRCYERVSSSHKPFYAFGQRLESMSIAIGEMNSAISKTAKVLDNENIHDPSQIYIDAADSICVGCKNNMYCWGSCYNRSADIMNKAIANIRQGALADENMLGGHFAEVCEKRHELSAQLNRRYAAFTSAQSAARKVTEMRTMLASQLSATELMLKRVSEELCTDDSIDTESAEKAEQVLTENGIKNAAVTAININGRLTIDAYGQDTPLFVPENIHKKLAFTLRKEFDPPMIAENGNGIHITLSERSLYDAQIKTFNRNKGGNRHSGDCFDCFNDGKGSVYMILSDGMGSGSRARIDSVFSCTMLVKMLKAGIDFDAAIEMLNNSLMVKSADESFATLDVCRINLYSGEISLYKAGSASTFVRCGSKFAELSGDGIPLGVSFNAEYSENRFALGFGDVIIMASDGADIDKEWLEKIVMREKSADLNTIIDTVGEALRLSAEKGKEDDITVIGVKITK